MRSAAFHQRIGKLAANLLTSVAAGSTLSRNRVNKMVADLVDGLSKNDIAVLARRFEYRFVKNCRLEIEKREKLVEAIAEGLLEMTECFNVIATGQNPEGICTLVYPELLAYYADLCQEDLSMFSQPTLTPLIPDAPTPAPKSAVVTKGSFANQGSSPEPGQIAWVLVSKKGKPDCFKQARCIVHTVSKRVKVMVTKTRRELEVELDILFDHVPQFVNGIWC